MGKGFFDIPKIWSGRCYILGGGPSLSTFPFESLQDKHVVGANDNYMLGSEIVDVCVFGDFPWFDIHARMGLFKYNGLIITNNESIRPGNYNEIKVCKKTNAMLNKKTNTLGWFKNTGIMAVEVAIKLGCTEIILLGFDMGAVVHKDGTRTTNYYRNLKNEQAGIVTQDKIYDIHMRNFGSFARQCNLLWKNSITIINANMDSNLTIFPKQEWNGLI